MGVAFTTIPVTVGGDMWPPPQPAKNRDAEMSRFWTDLAVRYLKTIRLFSKPLYRHPRQMAVTLMKARLQSALSALPAIGSSMGSFRRFGRHQILDRRVVAHFAALARMVLGTLL